MKLASFRPFTFSVLLAACTLPLHGQTTTVASGPMPAPTAEMLRLAQTARDADLRGDWNGLLQAHDGFEAMTVRGRQQAWVDYYLGYIDWRQSSLAYMGKGWSGWGPLLRQASDHLGRALETVPELTEARLLLAIVDASLIGPDPRRAPDLVARMRTNADRAVAEAPANPRVRLMRAMLAFFTPANSREEKDNALNAWRDAAESSAGSRIRGR